MKRRKKKINDERKLSHTFQQPRTTLSFQARVVGTDSIVLTVVLSKTSGSSSILTIISQHNSNSR